MQTVAVAYDAYEQDLLLPTHIQHHWRAELCPIILRDIQRGLFGDRRYHLWSYSARYHLNLSKDALSCIRSNLNLFLEDDARYISSLREALTHAKIRLSFEMNAITPDEVQPHSQCLLTPPWRIVPTCSLLIVPTHFAGSQDIRRSSISEHLSSLQPTMTIGLAYEDQPRASTSSSRTMVNDEYQPHSASSSTTTLAQSSPPQHLQQLWTKYESSPPTDVKPRSLDMESTQSSQYSASSSSHQTTPTTRPHPRHLPLDRRFKQITESSRAKKTHVLALDAETLEAFGGYGSLANPADTHGESRGVVGRFLRTLGLQKKSTSLPRAGRANSTFGAGSRVRDEAENDDFDPDSDGGEMDIDTRGAPGLDGPLRVHS